MPSVDNLAGRALLEETEETLRRFPLGPGLDSPNLLTAMIKNFRVERVTSEMQFGGGEMAKRLERLGQSCDKAIALLQGDDAHLGRAHFAAGRVASLLGNWEASQTHYRAALEHGADESLVRYFLAVTYDLDGPEAAEAITNLKAIIAIQGEESRAAMEAAKHIKSIEDDPPIKPKGESKSSCFVATAVYGSDDAPDVQLLRIFRDTVLLRHKLTEQWVRSYYRYGPSVAKLVRRAPGLAVALRLGFFLPFTALLRLILPHR